MPGVPSLFSITNWNPHDNGGCKMVSRPPAQGPQICDLFVSWIGVLAKLDLRYRKQTCQCQANERPMMPSSDREVSKTRAGPKCLCISRVAPCTPPFTPTSSPNTNMRGLIFSSNSIVRRTASMKLIRGPRVGEIILQRDHCTLRTQSTL
jgi:hypothetical protein